MPVFLTPATVPQGTKLNELRALVRKNRADILGDNVSGSAASAFGAATSQAGNQYARATNDASLAAQDAFNSAIDSWSDTRLKGYLDARGVPVPHASKTDELRALVRKNYHKASTGWNSWTFDDFSVENLKDYLKANGDDAAKKTAEKSGATRDELVSAAQSAYASASSAGGSTYASATSYLTQATDSVRKSAFDTWSESDLKNYLDSYGIVSRHLPPGPSVDRFTLVCYLLTVLCSLLLRDRKSMNCEHLPASTRLTSVTAQAAHLEQRLPKSVRHCMQPGSGSQANSTSVPTSQNKTPARPRTKSRRSSEAPVLTSYSTRK